MKVKIGINNPKLTGIRTLKNDLNKSAPQANKISYTPQQSQVIDSRGKNMLVSASAGTGKTYVMVERIADLLIKGEVDLDRILVVTFTNFAAAQMKQKLRAKMAESQKSESIAYQLEKIDLCSISTIHSFCLEVLRNYFYVVDVDPAFAVTDKNQANIYKDRAFEEITLRYATSNDETYKKLYHLFNTTRDESNLKNEVYSLHDFSKSTGNFAEWYSQVRTNYDYSNRNVFAEEYSASFIAESNDYASAFCEYAQTAKQKFNSRVLAEFCSAVESELKVNPSNTIEDNYRLLQKKVEYPTYSKQAKIPPDGCDQDAFEKLCKEINAFYSKAKASRNGFAANVEFFNLPLQKERAEKTLVLLDKFIEIVNAFDESYSKIKRERSVLDFNDLEHLALEVMKDETALSELKQRYQLIFVDEYQDVNGVQEKIISTLAGDKNLFFVGDVKQSIYGFRESNPDIFAAKAVIYGKDADSEVIRLNTNFRSDNRILAKVNEIFNVCMTKDFGNCDYKGTSQISSNFTDDKILCPFEVESCEKVISDEDGETQTEITDIYDIASAVNVSRQSGQSAAVVAKIRQLVGTQMEINGVTRNVEYKDITILVRTVKKQTLEIYRQLIAANIPVDFSLESSEKNKEILDLTNFLRVLDNPYNDIYLAGTCLSHFGQLNEEELAQIRIEEKADALYDCLVSYSAKENGAKAKRILQTIEEYQKLAFAFPVDKLLQKLIIDTKYNLYVLSLPNGQLRCERMYQTVQNCYGKPYAQSVAKYLQYVDVYEEGQSAAGNTDGVKIITFHKSKGLEFPIVIAANLDHTRPPNKCKISRNFNLGIALNDYDFSTQTYYDSLPKRVIENRNALESNQEELRLLYVLLTRAQKYFYAIVPECNGIIKKPKYASSLKDWLWYCYGKGILEIKPFVGGKSSEDNIPVTVAQNTDKDAFESALSYRYPYEKYIDTPQKVAASKLKELFADEEEISVYSVRDLVEVKTDMNATYVGTAYHKVFEVLPLFATQSQVDAAIKELTEKGIIPPTVAVDASAVYNCLHNADLNAVCKGEIHHEIKFMLRAPYNTLVTDSDNDENVTLQGVIDLMVISGNTASVIDFKYTRHPETIVEKYTPQLSAYVTAVRKILKCDNVSGYVMSVIDNTLIKLV